MINIFYDKNRSLIESKFKDFHMRRQFYYEEGNSTIRTKKFNYEKEVLFWKKSSILRRKIYSEKGVFYQTEVLLCIQMSIRENKSIIRSSEHFSGKEKVKFYREKGILSGQRAVKRRKFYFCKGNSTMRRKFDYGKQGSFMRRKFWYKRRNFIIEKELRIDNKYYYTKRKFYLKKEGLLWKNSMRGRQFYYKIGRGMEKFHGGKEFPVTRICFSGKGMQRLQPSLVHTKQARVVYKFYD